MATTRQSSRQAGLAPSSTATPQFYCVIILALTVAFGTLYSLSTDSHTMNLRSTSTMEELSFMKLNFFQNKSNFLNVYFVKLAWLWTSLSFMLYSINYNFNSPSNSSKTIPIATTNSHLQQSIRRYCLATLYWYYLTQKTWFLSLGPSISHYILLFTGATCIPYPFTSLHQLSTNSFEICDSSLGKLKGGHDISGHTFLLSHAILLLLAIIQPSLPTLFPNFYNFISSNKNPKRLIGLTEKVVVYGILGLMGIFWFMLLNTSLFFHHWSEKVSGFAFALGGWWFMNL